MDPLNYFENNFVGSINICKAMKEYGAKNMIFSSTATAYGCSDSCVETMNIDPTHCYP